MRRNFVACQRPSVICSRVVRVKKMLGKCASNWQTKLSRGLLHLIKATLNLGACHVPRVISSRVVQVNMFIDNHIK